MQQNHLTPKQTYDQSEQFVWLFDERFDALCQSFQQFLKLHGLSNPQPILGYKLFPSLVNSPNSQVPNLHQLSPEQINTKFTNSFNPTKSPSDPINLASFTTNQLISKPEYCLFGSDPQISEKLNNKASQYQLLHSQNLPLPPFIIAKNVSELEKNLQFLIEKYQTLFVQTIYSAGGEYAGQIHNIQDFNHYKSRIKLKSKTNSPLLITKYFQNVISLSGHALISRNGKVYPLLVNRLLLDNFRFDGFLFPVYQSQTIQKKILNITQKVGKILANIGYWGYIAVDFLFKPDELLVINEVNVRFAGETSFLLPYIPYNLFNLLYDQDGTQPILKIRKPYSRIVVTKIRPQINQTYTRFTNSSSIPNFLNNKSNEFRAFFYKPPLYVVNAHFLGLAGKRFPLNTDEQELEDYYIQSREVF